ncbi:single-stranded DNA-binding protein, partial [Croceicoccus gelatinilyticus]|uniref:single-stranded DNA-binding protein n=1 Tax=Croceicoccus gelatinilyticus TaxID=2835536 RepID=UPI001CED0E2A
VDDFYAARSRTIPPLPWSNIAPPFSKESEFHRVTCFNGLAKTVGQYCSKGQLVSVQGRIHYTQWEDKDGVTRYGTEILADKVDFLSRGNGTNDNTDAPEID